MRKYFNLKTILCLLTLALAYSTHAAGAPAAAKDITSEQYRLMPHDLVKMFVQGEPDVSVERRIDSRGEITVPLLGPIKIAGLLVSEAQTLIVKRYVDAEIYIHPEVVVNVSEYAPREAVVMGQVEKPGKVAFPPEASSLSIVDLIALSGGFTRLANPHNVSITRKDEQGTDHSVTLDVQKLIDGHTHDEVYQLQPGDVVFVPERMF